MYDRNDYGFPVEDRFTAVVVETNGWYGFAVVEGSRMRLYFNLNGERVVENIDGVCEWRHCSQDSRTKSISVGMRIAFDKVVDYNVIQYWCLEVLFDEVYEDRRKPEVRRYGQFAFGYR